MRKPKHYGDAGALEQAERVRILYVAMTRARRRLVLCGVRAGGPRGGDPLRAGTPAELLRSPANERVASLMATPKRQADAVDRLLGRAPQDAS